MEDVKVQPQRQQTEIATAAGNEPPPSQGRPIDPNLDSDYKEILYGASNSMTSDLKSNLNPGSAPGWSSNASVREETLPEHRGVDLNLHSNSGAARIGGVGDKGFAARVLEKGHGLELCGKASEKLGFMEDDDGINIIVEETEDRDEDLVENADSLMIKNEKMYATAVQEENTTNFLNETAVGEMGSQQMIPGLSGRLENPGAPNIEDEWESEESDDDLQIVLNDNNHGPMGMERMIDEDDQDGEGLVIVADNADVSHHQNQAQRMMDEQEWGGEERGYGADGEKDSLDTTKASGGGGGAAPAAAQPKIAYSNHAFHHPFSSQFKYVRPGAAPLPPGGQVQPPISTAPPAVRGRGDWRPAGMQKAFHPGFFSNFPNPKAMKPTSQDLQIFWQSPDFGIPLRALNLRNPNLTLHHLKSSLFPATSIPHTSYFFTLNGKPLSDSTPLLQNHQITPFSTLTVHLRFHGGGGDGGATGAESRDCYLNMYAVKKPDKVDPNEMRLSKWVNCSLSNEPLRQPVVIDNLGNFFNKEALVEALLKKNMPKQFWYIKGLKDMITVELTEIPGVKKAGEVKFQCPITGLEFNGKNKFFAIRSCGHVLSAKGFKEVKSSVCLVCHKEFVESDKIVINGNEDEVNELWEKVLAEKGKVKDGKKSKKLKNGDGNGEEAGRLTGKKHSIGGNGAQNNAKASSKKFKAADLAPANASKEVYASLFTSSKKKDFKETYSCRSLPLGRN